MIDTASRPLHSLLLRLICSRVSVWVGVCGFGLVLHAFMKKRSESKLPASGDPFCSAMEVHLVPTLRCAVCPPHTPAEADKILKVIQLWSSRGVYDPAFVAAIEWQLSVAITNPSAVLPAITQASVAATNAAAAGNARAGLVIPRASAAGAGGTVPPVPAPAPAPPPPPAPATNLSTLLHLGPGYVVSLCKV